jgi:hypothetical protein
MIWRISTASSASYMLSLGAMQLGMIVSKSLMYISTVGVMTILTLDILVISRWQKLIQKPYEIGDDRGLKLVRAILRPLMLRRTRETKDKIGKYVMYSHFSPYISN